MFTYWIELNLIKNTEYEIYGHISNIAATSSGRDTTGREKTPTMSSSKKANIGKNGTACDSRSTPLTDMLNCSNSLENDEFVALFTSQSVSTSYESQPSTCIMPINFVCLDSSITTNNEGHTALDQLEIDSLDSQLQNLPEEIYISKPLDLCSMTRVWFVCTATHCVYVPNSNQSIRKENFSVEKVPKAIQVQQNMLKTATYCICSFKGRNRA